MSGLLIMARKTHINVIPNTINKYAKPKIIIFNKITINFILIWLRNRTTTPGFTKEIFLFNMILPKMKIFNNSYTN